jgi:hypothetical protein
MFKTYLFLILIFCFSAASWAQSGQIKLEYFENYKSVGGEIEISISILGGSQYDVGEFPEFRNLSKGARSIKHIPQVIAGKKETIHTIKQNYVSVDGGRIALPNFDLEINGKNNRFEGKVFVFEKIEAEVQSPTIEIEDVKLRLSTTKNKIFVGEGVSVKLQLIISKNTTTNWEFPTNISEQIEALSKKLKPKDCIENRMVISNITSKIETINNKAFDVYTLFESIYYPLNANSFNLPIANLKMVKLKNEKKTDVLLSTTSENVSVKNLPEHPLKEKVAIGVFSAIETMKGGKNKVSGEAFEYQIQINGNGNLNTLSLTEKPKDVNLDIFLSNAKVNQNPGRPDGNKIFNFKIIPRKLGVFAFKEYFNFVYFNTISERYDTLFVKKTINVSGEKIDFDEEAEKDIFDDIETLSTEGSYINMKSVFRILANILWLGIFSGFIYILFYFKK